MSRLLDDAQSEYLLAGSAPVTAAPFTVSAWARSDSIALEQSIVSIAYNAGGTNHYFALHFVGSIGGDPVWWLCKDTSYTYAATSSGYSANTWHHVCGIEAASDDRRVYLDGGSKGTDSASRTPSGINRAAVGVRCTGTLDKYLSGLVCEIAIWDVALTDAEVATLAAGVSPLFVRPESLVAYWPLGGIHGRNDNDRVGGYHLTAYNTPSWADHPRVIHPAPAFSPMRVTGTQTVIEALDGLAAGDGLAFALGLPAADALDAADGAAIALTAAALDGLSGGDSARVNIVAILADALASADSPAFQIAAELLDGIETLDAATVARHLTIVAADALGVSDAVAADVVAVAIDQLGAQDATKFLLGLVVLDQLGVVDLQAVVADFALADALGLADSSTVEDLIRALVAVLEARGASTLYQARACSAVYEARAASTLYQARSVD